MEEPTWRTGNQRKLDVVDELADAAGMTLIELAIAFVAGDATRRTLTQSSSSAFASGR